MDRPTAISEKALDALFHAPLEEFTAARNALAKQLREDGERDAADWVKALKKPTRAAWLINQLGSRKRDAVERLLERGEELRGLQAELLAGSVDRDRLRDAAQAEQRAIAELVQTAEAIGREHGIGAAVLDRVAETLQAASSDPEVAEAVGKGRLEREARATSLGLVGPATAAPKRGAGRGAKSGGAKAGAATDPDQKTAEEAAEEEARARRQAERRRRAAERKLAAARKRIERERSAVERAQEALGEREERLREAEAEAEAAQREIEEA